jgi:hypothetical protein
MGGNSMKRFLSVLIIVIFAISPMKASATVGDEYKEWLNTNHETGVSYDDITGMWETFWDYVTPPDEDAQILPRESDVSGIYNVEILAGTTGVGFKDGIKPRAKINMLSDLISTKNGDIYFTDGTNKAIRKINSQTGNIETVYKLEDSLNVTFTSDKRTYDVSKADIVKVSYNPSNDSVYFAVSYDAVQSYALTVIYKLEGDKPILCYDRHTKVKAPFMTWTDFLKFDGNKVWYSERFGLYGMPSYILTADTDKDTQQAKVIGTFNDENQDLTNMRKLRGRNDVIIKDGFLYIYDTFYRDLRKINIETLESTTIAKHNLWMSAVVASGDKFYLADGSTIYEMDLEGNTKAILDNDNFSKKVGNITAINLDLNGNLLISDTLGHDSKGKVKDCSIKRISMSGR